MQPQRLRFTTSASRSNIDHAVALLAQNIAAQRYRITELARQGRDTRQARSVLQELESRIAHRIVERDQGDASLNPASGRLSHA